MRNWELLKLVTERQVYRGIAQTFSVVAQLIITKSLWLFPFLDSLIIQMWDRFYTNEDRHARHLLHLVPSIIVNNTLELSKATEGMMFWENDLPFPKSLGNELRIWQIMRQSAEKELPSNLLLALGTCDGDAFPNIFFSLRAPYQSVVRKLSGPFRSRNGSRRTPDQRCVKSAFPISLLLLCITLRDSR